MKDDIARAAFKAGALQERAKPRPRPFSDAAPALDAIMPCDLRPRRHGAQLRKGEAGRARDKAAHIEPIIREIVFGNLVVKVVIRVRGAVRLEKRRNVRFTELGRKRVWPQRALDGSVHRFGASKNAARGSILT